MKNDIAMRHPYCSCLSNSTLYLMDLTTKRCELINANLIGGNSYNNSYVLIKDIAYLFSPNNQLVYSMKLDCKTFPITSKAKIPSKYYRLNTCNLLDSWIYIFGQKDNQLQNNPPWKYDIKCDKWHIVPGSFQSISIVCNFNNHMIYLGDWRFTIYILDAFDEEKGYTIFKRDLTIAKEYSYSKYLFQVSNCSNMVLMFTDNRLNSYNFDVYTQREKCETLDLNSTRLFSEYEGSIIPVAKSSYFYFSQFRGNFYWTYGLDHKFKQRKLPKKKEAFADQ